MERYRSKPRIILAQRFEGPDDAAEIIRMTTGVREERAVDAQGNLVPILIIKVYESEVQVAIGDWVAVDKNGVAYPIKNDVFEDAWEPATAEVPQ